jgi:regulatory protein YycI of two-component signal transduction system YycFG
MRQLEWKRVKTMLIILFLALNLFLIYNLYDENMKETFNQETFNSLSNIMISRNIKLLPDIKKISTAKKMKRMLIESEKGFMEDFVKIVEPSGEIEGNFIGRSKEIISPVTLLTNFIRDTKYQDITISSINLGYFYDSNQIEEGVLSGEASPVWIIDISNGERYIYSAYTGALLNKRTNN